MLCGELGGGLIHSRGGLTRSPYSTLLNLYNMDATPTDEDAFLENSSSYENPNYNHQPNINDALNSNTDISTYRQLLYDELETLCRLPAGRKAYASLDIESMGVDLNTGPVTLLDTDNSIHRKSGGHLDNGKVGNVNRGIDTTASVVPNKLNPPEDCNTDHNKQLEISLQENYEPDNSELLEKRLDSRSPSSDFSSDEVLPPGWEKHQDSDGPYYWHIKSGTIQRAAPESERGNNEPKTPLMKDAETVLSNFHQNGGLTTVRRSNTSSALADGFAVRSKDSKWREEMALKRRSYPARADPKEDKVIRFAVRSLGWVDISELELTPERSSKAVNKCIVELSLGRNGLIDNVGRWGDGKDLLMDLDEGSLKLVDPENLTVLNTQPIHTIRVWGVGRDNGRDFAYVARDRITRKHMCHVFRCDMPARKIANTLRDICKKIMIERSLQQNLAKPVDTNGFSGRASLATRPTNLPTENRKLHRNPEILSSTQSFPTPMEEPKKVLQAEYLGNIEVSAASGIDVLNTAIEQLTNTVPRSQWQTVDISIAPSMITITPSSNNEGNIETIECRVRYLSFLGIGQNVQQCAFIMHTAQDLYIAHVFHCEPSSGALCKTVEAACKLRYQKCLDAHPQSGPNTENQSPTRGLGATLKSLVGSITGRRAKKS